MSVVLRLEDLLAISAISTPDTIVLVEREGRKCSYSQLEALAQAFSGRLREAGVVPGDRVGICASKCIETVAAIFAVLKTGAAYVPTDPDAPPARSATIFSDCGARAVFVDPNRGTALAQALRAVGYAERGAEPLDGFELILAESAGRPSDGDLAYILYTSGSTGVPKGVSHTHASALGFINWCSLEFVPKSMDRFSSHAPLHFDLAIFDIFLAIKHGSLIRLIGADEGRDPRMIAQIIASEQLTVWYSTPTSLRALLQHGNLSAFDHSSLRLVCFAGEVFPGKHLRALAACWQGAKFYNLYGPTETNVCAFYHVQFPQEQSDHAPIPIGSACLGTQLRIVSPCGESLPLGEEGELLVSGDSVMKGYWGLSDASSGAFVVWNGRRWYRTGDIVVQRDDGELVFRGRRDRMIKRRGYRIELAEIEAALSCHEHISQAAVVAIPDATGDTRIVAFHTWALEVPPSFTEMKRYCQRALPSYMSPDLFKVLPDIMHTSTGKIDYRRLQEIA